MSSEVTLKSRRVVLESEVVSAVVHVRDGLIAEIEKGGESADVDLGDLALMPGVIDPHVHFNEPGRTEWEGWESGTRAALAGGVTTVVDMPLNCIPSTVDVLSLEKKRKSTNGKLYCDVGLWGGAVKGSAGEILALLDAGVLGMKCFLSDPGTAEFSNLNHQELREAMVEIAKRNAVLLVHAEWPDQLLPPSPEYPSDDYRAWLHTRPPSAETEAIRRVAQLSGETGCRCHIVHVATTDAFKVLKESHLTCETCAHYLVFAAEDIPSKATNFKCAPPIRSQAEQDGLWQHLLDGDIQMITSDHSPCPPDLKSDDFLTSWGGIAGVQMLLPAVWTGARKRGISLDRVSQWLSAGPAGLLGRERDLGKIAPSYLADFVVFSPDTEFVCDSLHHRHAGSPYEGRSWFGEVKETWLRGQCVYRRGHFEAPSGQLI